MFNPIKVNSILNILYKVLLSSLRDLFSFISADDNKIRFYTIAQKHPNMLLFSIHHYYLYKCIEMQQMRSIQINLFPFLLCIVPMQ